MKVDPEEVDKIHESIEKHIEYLSETYDLRIILAVIFQYSAYRSFLEAHESAKEYYEEYPQGLTYSELFMEELERINKTLLTGVKKMKEHIIKESIDK